MADAMDRRNFMKTTMTAAAAGGLLMSLEEQALLAQEKNDGKNAPPASQRVPMGRIGDVQVSRLICGGNLLNGFAHARDLIYVSELLKHYFTDEKIMDTWQLCEEHGINTMISTCDSPYAGGSDPTVRVLNRYRKERGGRIQWLAQCQPGPKELMSLVQKAIDNGATGVFLQGEIGDRWVAQNRLDLVDQVISYVKKQGLLAGIAGHSIDVPIACESAGIHVDFYMKTLHHHNYWSARPDEQRVEVIRNSNDNYWSMTPEETIQFMKQVKKPWIAYKVLAAGAIQPRDGFDYAFGNGADFACVGMFDFQVAEDAQAAREITLKHQARRGRPWRG